MFWLGTGTGFLLAEERFTFHHENVMGTSLELQVLADQEGSARWAEAEVLAEIDRLSTIFSTYDPNSELSQWLKTRNEPTHLSPELFKMLTLCDTWRDRSLGAFDVRVDVLSRLWAQAARGNQIPTDEAIHQALANMAQPAWQFTGKGTTTVRMSDGPVTLNAIAKGTIVELACQRAYQPDRGILGLLLNVGGDLCTAGQISAQVAVMDPTRDSESSEPLALLKVQNRAVSTSGASQRHFVIQGHKYSHILDPRSGRPVERVASATVIAPRASDSDALATICNVLPPEESLRLVDSVEGAACLVISTDGRQFRSHSWNTFEVLPQGAPAQVLGSSVLPGGQVAEPQAKLADDPSQVWDPEFEMELSFEILKPEVAERRYRRPYVVAWIEDSEGRTVRTLFLWVSLGGSGPDRWLPDLKRWYRGDQDELSDKKNMVFTVARPTRTPGKYSALWDGKDDMGKLVSKGKYTLLIDSAREHGTYQHIKKPLEFGNEPLSINLNGNPEIGSPKVEYRKRAK